MDNPVIKISDIMKSYGIHYLYHFTPVDNIPKLKDSGYIIYSRKQLLENNIQAIYMTDELSHKIDEKKNCHKYVFLVFRNDHPLIYKNQMNNVELLPIKIKVEILDLPGVMFCTMIATDNDARFCSIDKALQLFDLRDSVDGKRIPSDARWNEVKKYEVLVPEKIDLNKYYYGV